MDNFDDDLRDDFDDDSGDDSLHAEMQDDSEHEDDGISIGWEDIAIIGSMAEEFAEEEKQMSEP